MSVDMVSIQAYNQLKAEDKLKEREELAFETLLEFYKKKDYWPTMMELHAYLIEEKDFAPSQFWGPNYIKPRLSEITAGNEPERPDLLEKQDPRHQKYLEEIFEKRSDFDQEAVDDIKNANPLKPVEKEIKALEEAMSSESDKSTDTCDLCGEEFEGEDLEQLNERLLQHKQEHGDTEDDEKDEASAGNSGPEVSDIEKEPEQDNPGIIDEDSTSEKEKTESDEQSSDQDEEDGPVIFSGDKVDEEPENSEDRSDAESEIDELVSQYDELSKQKLNGVPHLNIAKGPTIKKNESGQWEKDDTGEKVVFVEDWLKEQGVIKEEQSN